jgi:hypothetical protein
VLLQRARMIRRGGQEAMPEERDREDIEHSTGPLSRRSSSDEPLANTAAAADGVCQAHWQLLSSGRPAIAPV